MRPEAEPDDEDHTLDREEIKKRMETWQKEKVDLGYRYNVLSLLLVSATFMVETDPDGHAECSGNTFLVLAIWLILCMFLCVVISACIEAHNILKRGDVPCRDLIDWSPFFFHMGVGLVVILAIAGVACMADDKTHLWGRGGKC